MEVTLEKIELVKDRTGVSYKEAKDALEAADGSVVDAIISIEEVIDAEASKSVQDQGAAVIDSVKDLVKKGNVSKIVVKKTDGEVLLNLPVNAGILATVLAPWGVLAGILSSFAFKCVVEVVKDDGTIVDVSDRANDAFGKAVEKGSAIKDAAIEKGEEVVGRVKDSDVVDKVKNSDLVDKVKSSDIADRVRSNDTVGKVVGKASETFDKAEEAFKERFGKDAPEEAEEDAEGAVDTAAEGNDEA